MTSHSFNSVGRTIYAFKLRMRTLTDRIILLAFTKHPFQNTPLLEVCCSSCVSYTVVMCYTSMSNETNTLQHNTCQPAWQTANRTVPIAHIENTGHKWKSTAGMAKHSFLISSSACGRDETGIGHVAMWHYYPHVAGMRQALVT